MANTKRDKCERDKKVDAKSTRYDNRDQGEQVYRRSPSKSYRRSSRASSRYRIDRRGAVGVSSYPSTKATTSSSSKRSNGRALSESRRYCRRDVRAPYATCPYSEYQLGRNDIAGAEALTADTSGYGHYRYGHYRYGHYRYGHCRYDDVTPVGYAGRSTDCASYSGRSNGRVVVYSSDTDGAARDNECRRRSLAYRPFHRTPETASTSAQVAYTIDQIDSALVGIDRSTAEKFRAALVNTSDGSAFEEDGEGVAKKETEKLASIEEVEGQPGRGADDGVDDVRMLSSAASGSSEDGEDDGDDDDEEEEEYEERDDDNRRRGSYSARRERRDSSSRYKSTSVCIWVRIPTRC